MTDKTMFDVIIVGLGAVGGAAAYQLAGRGAKVLGIDKHTPPHNLGSSHGETRITREAIGEGAHYLPLVRRTNAIWRDIEAQTGEKLLHVSGGYIIEPIDGGAQFHGQRGFVERSADIAAAHQIHHEIRSADEVRADVPSLLLADTDHAYYEPDAGVLMVERCVEAQAKLATQRGAVLNTGERVQSIDPQSTHVIVRTEHRTYHAEQVILAAGAWNRHFLPEKQAIHLGVYRQVMYWFETHNLSAFDVSQFPWVIWIGDTLDSFFAAFPGVIGGIPGVKVMTEVYQEQSDPDDLRRTISAAEITEMSETFVKRRLRGVGPELVTAAACAYTVTPDEHFVIDRHPSSERVWVASACSGHGFKHAAAIGEALAETALGLQPTVDLSTFRFGRFPSEKR